MDLFDIALGRQGGSGGGKLPIDLVEKTEYFEVTTSLNPDTSVNSINSFVELEIGDTCDLHIEATTENAVYSYDFSDVEATNMALALAFSLEGEFPGFYIIPESLKDQVEIPSEVNVIYSDKLQFAMINELNLTDTSRPGADKDTCTIMAAIIDADAGEIFTPLQVKITIGKTILTGKVEEKYLPVFQANMSESDEKNPAYIRNRTHYTEKKEVDYITFEPNFNVSREASTYPFSLGLELGKEYECKIYNIDGTSERKLITCTANKVTADGVNTTCPALGGDFGLLIDGLILSSSHLATLGEGLAWAHQGRAIKIEVYGFPSRKNIIQKLPYEYYDFQEFVYKFDFKKWRDIDVSTRDPKGKVIEPEVQTFEEDGKFIYQKRYFLCIASQTPSGTVTKLFDIPAEFGPYSEIMNNIFNNVYDYRSIYLTHPALGKDAIPVSYMITGLKDLGYIIDGRTIIASHRTTWASGNKLGLRLTIEFSFASEELRTAVINQFGDIFDNPDYISIGYVKPAPPSECNYLGGV